MGVALKPYEDDIFKGMIPAEKTDGPIDGAWIKIKNKIPRSALQQIYGVFNHCQHKLNRSEGFVVLMNNDSPVWSVGVPQQWNGGAHVDAHPEKDAGTIFKNVVGDAHSHPMMGAFHSGVDEADEAKHRHGIYIVFSSTEQGFSLMTSTINVIGIARGHKFQLDPNEIFDLDSDVKCPAIVPANWQENISTKECPVCPKKAKIWSVSKSEGKMSREDRKSFKEWLKGFGRGGSHFEGGF